MLVIFCVKVLITSVKICVTSVGVLHHPVRVYFTLMTNSLYIVPSA